MVAKGFVKVHELYCKGCGLCVEVCPQGALRLSEKLTRKGYHQALVVTPNTCTACARCALVCPDAALTVTREIAVEQIHAHAANTLGKRKEGGE